MKYKKWGMCCEAVPTVDPKTGKCQNGCDAKPSQKQSDVTLKVEHTPTPWIHAQAKSGHQAIYDATEKVQLVRFGEGQDEDWREPKNAKANAAFIVKAVNAYEHDQQIKEEFLEMVKEMYSAIVNGHSLKFTHEQYKDAIARAEGMVL